MSLINSLKSRAAAQTRATIETHDGRATATYYDDAGNVISTDVLLDGQVSVLKNVPNASGAKLNKGDYIKVNFSKGSRLNPQVIGAGGTAGSTAVQAAGAAQSALTDTALAQSTADLSQEPLLVASPDDLLPNAYVLSPGSNISLQYLPGEVTSGGVFANDLEITARPLVMASLPEPNSGLPAGTVIDLTDSYGNALGMYRLDEDAVGLTWRRRDGGTGAVSYQGGLAQWTRITLGAPPQIIGTVSGKVYLLVGDFSAAGLFDDENCITNLTLQNSVAVSIKREETACTNGQQAWTVQVLSTAQSSYYSSATTAALLFNRPSVKNTGWTGTQELNVPTVWTVTEIV